MAKFSKQHYQMIAGALRADYVYASEEPVRQRIACQIANVFESDNPRFNREHFLAVVRGERAVNSRPPRS